MKLLLTAATAAAVFAFASPAFACDGNPNCPMHKVKEGHAEGHGDCAAHKAKDAKAEGCDPSKCDPSKCDTSKCDPAKCAHGAEMKAEAGKVGTLTVAELAKGLAAKDSAPHVFDANTAETRNKEGIIPGAKLLTSVSQYDVGKELPAEKDASLVFYCASEKCGASHQAAARALGAGFKNVKVLPAGIKGWKAAGQKTSPVPGA